MARTAVPQNRIVQADCIEWLEGRPPFADLIFADPPFNIGYQYDVYEDRKAYEEYSDWTRRWMRACCAVLKPTGSFWVAIGDEYAAEVRLIGRELELCLRNWVIWHYTFGQNTKAKFARSHTHLFYFVKDPVRFTFNADAVRVMSDRQKEYHDRRANPLGKIPFDVWTEFSRVCGTFAEREGWHPCQMPETVLARVLRACSNVGDLVYDPFAGSGTTLAVAKKLGRRFLGTEVSSQYVAGIRERLAGIEDRDEKTRPDSLAHWPPTHREELASLYQETGVSTDQMWAEPFLFENFCQQFNRRMAHLGFEGAYTPEEVWAELEWMRTNVKLPRIKVHAQDLAKGKVRPVPRARRRAAARSLFDPA